MRFAAMQRLIYAMTCITAASVGLGFCGTLHAQVHAYTADPNTIYLYHFNEAAGASSAANSGSSGVAAISFDGTTFAGDGLDQPTLTTLLGSAGFSGTFGNAANITSTTVGFGVDFSGNGAYQLDDSAPVTNDRLASHASIFGTGNAFTLEAMVNVPSITTGNRQIISSDNSSTTNATRGFQFRINSTGNLEFNFIAPNVGAVSAPIPTVGAHAFVANEWFHAAMAYDGTSARFYWTKVDAAFSAANLIGGPTAEGVDVNAPMLLTIGTDGRVVGATASNEGLVGLIDEVRISNVSRGAAEFIFGVPIVPGDVNGDLVADINDFNIIKMNLFNTGQTRQQGDIAGGDGIVDFADYRQWKNAAAPAVAASVSLFGEVPEPASGLLLAASGALLFAARRRRRASLRSAS